jgi:PAT family beta-lactamase induction signal transducer AmpG
MLKTLNLLDTRNGRFLTFGLLYVSEGIPLGFTTIAMVAFMRQHGVGLDVIGAFSAALFLPSAFKWAWAPLVDLVRLDRWGGRRAWIIACTTMMLVTLMIAGSIDAEQHFMWLIAIVFVHDVFAATQDVAIDSLAVSTLKADERARGNGFMFAGQYVGIMLGGGAAIYVSGLVGFRGSLVYVGILCLMNLAFVLLFVRDPGVRPPAPRQPHLLRALATQMVGFVKKVYVSFWKSGRGPMLGTAFALLPCGAMALGYAILSTILVDYGLDNSQIAQLQVWNTIAGAIGCLLGGVLGDRFGLKRIVAAGYALTALVAIGLATQIAQVGLTNVAPGFFFGSIIAHGFVYGIAFGTCNAIFMGMTNPAVAATQFTAFMGMGNLAISFGNYWQGIVAERMGYAAVLYADATIALLVIGLIPFLSGREDASESELPAGPLVPTPAAIPSGLG